MRKRDTKFGLTDLQREVLRAIHARTSVGLRPPSVREILNDLPKRFGYGTNSMSNITYAITRLEEKGALGREPGKARSYQVQPLAFEVGWVKPQPFPIPILSSTLSPTSSAAPAALRTEVYGARFAMRVEQDDLRKEGVWRGDVVVVGDGFVPLADGARALVLLPPNPIALVRRASRQGRTLRLSSDVEEEQLSTDPTGNHHVLQWRVLAVHRLVDPVAADREHIASPETT